MNEQRIIISSLIRMPGQFDPAGDGFGRHQQGVGQG